MIVSLSRPILRPLVFPIACLCMGTGISDGEIRLLTGDVFGGIHSGGGEIKDIAGNGDLVLFTATLNPSAQVPGLPGNGLYLRKITEETLEFVGDASVSRPGVLGAEVSDDGNFLTWAATDRQIYWRNRGEGTTRLITRGITGLYGNPRLSADGRYVAFASSARNLVTDTAKLPNNGRAGVYLYDSDTDSTSIVSLSSTGGRLTGAGLGASAYEDFDFSKDGGYVAFTTEDPNAHPDRAGNMVTGAPAVYRRNISTGELLLLNRNAFGQVANGIFSSPRISADGRRAAFLGGANGVPGLVKMISTFPASNSYDVYVKDVSTGQVWGLTKTTDNTPHPGLIGDAPVISDSGTVVAFPSLSGKLIPNDDPGSVIHLSDIFQASLSPTGSFLLSLATRSEPPGTNVVHEAGQPPFLSQDGSFVAFNTRSFSQLGILGTSGFAHGVGSGIFPVPPNLGLPFFIWAFNLPFGMQGPNDNPSGDGIPNLVKFFIGSDARVPDFRFLPSGGIAKGSALGLPSDTRDYMTLTVRIRRELRLDYNWSVETSQTLIGLATAPVPAIQVGIPAADGDFDLYLFRFPTPVSGKGFMRLRTTIPVTPEF